MTASVVLDMVIGRLPRFNVEVNLTGARLGQYRLEEPLHSGGGGWIYRARDLVSTLPAAVKVPLHLQRHEIEALRSEAAVLGRLRSAGIRGVVQLYDQGVQDGRPWYAMELLRGTDLRTLLRAWRGAAAYPAEASRAADEAPTQTIEASAHSVVRARIEAPARLAPAYPTYVDSKQRVPVALRIVRALATTLHQVHSVGILHGDLSPANVLLDTSLEPTILDFGTSLVRFESGRQRETFSHWLDGRATPGYAAPEALHGRTLDSRCDIYSLGCIAYELLFGRRPFAEPTADGRELEFPREAADLVSPEVLALLRRMLARNPARRSAHAHAVARVLAGELGDDAPELVASSSRDVMLFRPRLRGREEASSALARAAVEARSGRGALVLLSAPSGLGKTRLLDEFAHAEPQRGMRIVATQCERTAVEGGVQEGALRPFRPLFELAPELGLGNGAAASAFEPWVHAALRPYLPEAGAARSVDPVELAAPRAVERVFDALDVVLERLSRDRPTLVLIDDLEWADDLSLRFLAARARGLSELPLLVVCALRSDAALAAHELVAKASHATLTPRPLAEPELADVAKDLLGTETLPEGLVAVLHRHSEGNPFFVAEYVRALVDGGLLWQTEERWHLRSTTREGASLALPRSLEELWSARAEQVSANAASVLRIAAVVGREFESDLLRELVPPGTDASAALQELVSRQLLERRSSHRFRFVHDQFRESVQLGLGAAERRDVHHAVALALERRADEGAPRRSASLGYHWAAAEQPERALPYLEAAAQAALSEHDVDAACELLRLAVAQAENSSGSSGAQAARLDEALADVLVVRALHSEARARYARALERLASAAHLVRARLHRKRAASHWTVHDYEDAHRALTDSEAELARLSMEEESELQELIEVRLGRFEQLYFSQRLEALEPLVDELVQLVERHGTAKQRMASYLAAASYGMLRRRYGFDPRAVELTGRAVVAAEALSLDARAVARFNHGFALCCGEVQHCRQALEHFRFAESVARELRITTLLSRVATYTSITRLRLGDVPGTADAAEVARQTAEASRLVPYIAAAKACEGWVHWRRGEDAAARESFEAARQLWREQAHPFPMRWMTTFALLTYAEAANDLEAVRGYLAEFREPGMQAMPDELKQALDAVDASLAHGAEPPEVSLGLRALLRTARETGHC